MCSNGHRVQASSSTASRCTSGGKDDEPVTRPLTFNKSNRDYNSQQQHNNYNRDFNRDYNNYRNYGNNSSNSNYHQTNNSSHHRAFNNLNQQPQQQSNNQQPPPLQQLQQLQQLNSGTLGARPFEANQINQQHHLNKPIIGQQQQQQPQSNVSLNSSIDTSLPDIDSYDNEKPSQFTKWIPPSVTSKSENLTEDDRNNIVFRRVRGILNKITPDKFAKLSDELLQCELDSAAILKGVVVLIFNKALEEPKYSSMYAQLCRKISEGVKNFEYENPDYVKQSAHDNTFCRYLLAKCQHEFNNRLQASEAFGDGPLSDEEEERRDQAKKMMLGNIKFICELGKQNLADENILHRCIMQLCKKKNNIKHIVEDFECLCQIMKTVGRLLDTERGKALMDQYFSRMEKYANSNELPLRIKFKIQDVLDLRRNKWVPRNIQMIDQNPRTLGQIREEATKDYSFLQPGGSIMGNFTSASVNQYGGNAGGLQFNVRGSSQYGQQQNVHQLSGQRALDDLYGTNLPSFGNTSGNSSTNSFDRYENSSSNTRYEPNNSNSNNSNNYQQSNPQQQQPPQQPPRRIINQQPSFLANSNNGNNNNNSNNQRYQNNKMNDMSSSSSNSSSLRDDDQQQQQHQQQHNQQNYNKNYSDDQRPNYQQQNNYRQNNRYNNYNQQPNNNYYQNRNNSGERGMNQMNNKMGNMNLRDQNQGNRTANELPPRFQKMQQQQNQNLNLNSNPNQPPPAHRNYNNPQQQPQDSYNNQQQRNPPNHHYNNNNYNNNQQQPNQYYQRNQQNNYNNNQINNQQQGNHHLPNQKIINFNAMDTKEISLRPAKNFFSPKPINLGAPGGNQRNDLNDNLSQNQDNLLNRNQLNKPNTPIKQFENKAANQPIEPPVKEEQKEDYLNKVNEILGKFIQKEQEEEETIKLIKELKTTKVSKSELLVHVMKYGLDKSEQERELITKFVTKFKQDDFCSVDDYKQAFKQTLSGMRDLEVDVPKIKSFVAVYIAFGISDGIIDLNDAFDLTVKTVYYPLFLLTLQYLGQNQDQQWLIKKFNDSKLDLMLALPEIDRNKERLSEVLRDRQLGFLYPLLRIESELMKQVNSGNEILPKALYSWIKENVDSELQRSEGFIFTLFTCIAKYVVDRTKDQIDEIEKEEGSNTDKRIIELQKGYLSKYAKIFQSFLLDRQNLQLALLYALQTYCHKLQFPKGMIFRWFIMLYDLEIVDSEVFLKWKEEVNDDYPDKGRALFQVNTWLTWLEKAEQDDEEEDDE